MLAVFDCDGTLVDSLGSISATVSAAWRALSLPPPGLDDVRRFVGLPLEESISLLAPELDKAIHRRLRDAYRDAYFAMLEAGEEGDALYPGIVGALDSLDNAGFLLGVATGKGRHGLSTTLARSNLTSRFVTLQTSDVARGKPDPEMLERAMAETGATPDTTVMIGDTTFDMLMARNAGTAALGVSWGYHGADDLEAAGAHRIVDTADELAEAVVGLFDG